MTEETLQTILGDALEGKFDKADEASESTLNDVLCAADGPITDPCHSELLKIHVITQSIATVEPITDDDTMTVRRVKEMAQLINKLTEVEWYE